MFDNIGRPLFDAQEIDSNQGERARDSGVRGGERGEGEGEREREREESKQK